MFNTFELVFWGWVPIGLFSFFLCVYFLHNKGIFKTLVVMVGSSFVSVFFPFVTFLFCLFYFILVLNFVGLIPFSFPVSALVCISLFFAFLGWLGNYIFILFLNFKANVSHFLPISAPSFLMVLLVWIEFISWLARPISLGVRLVANITAGHLLIHLMSSGVYFNVSVFVLFFFFILLEGVVAVVQAYVYSLLLSLYVNEGLE